MDRNFRVYDGQEIIEQGMRDVSWDEIRHYRDAELVRTDPWALKDRTMSQEKKDYRTFLRDLPGNHDSANDAADAWAAYEIPE
jgi:hypothetical protein